MSEGRTGDTRALGSVAGLAVAIVSAAIPPFLIGALAPRISDSIVFDTRDLGLAMAGFFLVSGLLSPAGGHAVNRLGPTASLRWACGLTTVGLLGIAVAPNAMQVIIVLTLLGIPNAVVQPACNEVLSGLRRPQVRAVSFGVVQASIPAATLIAGVLLAVASYGGGWRWTIVGVAALTVVAQAPIPRLPRTGRAAGQGRPAAAPVDGTAAAPTSAAPSLLPTLVATGFLASCAVTCLPAFTATTGQHLGLAPWLVALAQTLGSVGSALMRVVAPALTSRSSVRRQLTAVALLQGSGVLGFLGLASGSDTGFVLGAVAAFTLGWGFNGLFNLIVTNAHPDRIATATGLTQGGVFLGGMTGPLVFAAIAGTEHFATAWSAMALIMCTALGATLLAARRSRSVTERGRLREPLPASGRTPL